jgi:hypothetical protein
LNHPADAVAGLIDGDGNAFAVKGESSSQPSDSGSNDGDARNGV